MLDLDTTGYYALGVPLYLALAAADVMIARRRGEPPYGFGDSLSNIMAGLGEVVLGLFLGPRLVALYDWAFANLALVRWPEGSMTSWIVAFLAADLGYYWYHRAGHAVALLFAVHGVHHQSERFNLTLAMRHPWFSDVYSFPFYAGLPLLGVPSGQFFVAISLISFYALTVHTMSFRRPGWALVTPQTHVVHHARNPRYVGRNLGAMFTLWDRLFGTHVEVDPRDPPELGHMSRYRTHSGALAQWIFFRDLFGIARLAPTWRERLRVLLGPPGTRPSGVAAPAPEAPARSDADIPRSVRIHTASQLGVTILLSLDVLWFRDTHPFAVQLGAAVLIFWSLVTLGALLDGGPDAPRRERRRLWVGVGVAALTAALAPGYSTLGGLGLAAWGVGLLTSRDLHARA